jgi:hypothetical protein
MWRPPLLNFDFFFTFRVLLPAIKKRGTQKPSTAHFRRLREEFQVSMMVRFRKGIILQLVKPFQRNESIVSKNLNDDPGVSRDQKNESSLLQFDRAITSDEHVTWSKYTQTVMNWTAGVQKRILHLNPFVPCNNHTRSGRCCLSFGTAVRLFCYFSC